MTKESKLGPSFAGSGPDSWPRNQKYDRTSKPEIDHFWGSTLVGVIVVVIFVFVVVVVIVGVVVIIVIFIVVVLGVVLVAYRRRGSVTLGVGTYCPATCLHYVF